MEQAGVCPACQLPVEPGQESAACPDCGAAHHRTCLDRHRRCSAYACAPDVRRYGDIGRADIVIDADAVREAVPLRPARAAVRDRGPKTWSRMAIAALVLAVLGIPFFGLVVGPLAAAFGAVALGLILARGRQRGAVLAALAVFLGLIEFVGWFWWLYGNKTSTEVPMFFATEPVPPRDLDRVPEPIRSCLRASVAVQGSDGRLLGTRWAGSGVIVAAEAGTLLILTNRHVVDPKDTGRKDVNRFEVMLADGNKREATVRWMDLEGVDLALLACPGPAPEGLRLIAPRGEPPPVMGERVFAVGNPEGLHWTYTEGVISAVRDMKLFGPEVEVIQTQTPINHGNSGGGLFDVEGRLVGLNTWTQSKMETEGLNFAISVRTVIARLAGSGLEWKAESR